MPPASQQQQQQSQQLASKQAELMAKFEEYVDKIHYSERYSDDKYEYRHVILPKPLLKLIPKHFFNPDESGTLRLLSEAEWRGIGITQSLGWVHYEVHTPEPHVLLFRRELGFQPPQHLVQNGLNGRQASHAKFTRK